MKKAYVDESKKGRKILYKHDVHTFNSGNELHVFPYIKNKKRLQNEIKKSGAEIITDSSSDAFKEKIYFKTIIQILKETGADELVLSFDNSFKNINLISMLFTRDIPFSLYDCDGAEQTSDFFLEKHGLPITVVRYFRSGLFVCLNGPPPFKSGNLPVLDLSGDLSCSKIAVKEYLLKNMTFPIEISSLPILETALELTGKDISDIIIKAGIIGQDSE